MTRIALSRTYACDFCGAELDQDAIEGVRCHSAICLVCVEKLPKDDKGRCLICLADSEPDDDWLLEESHPTELILQARKKLDELGLEWG